MEVEISIGELVDKVTILEIKLERISSPEKIANVRREYDLLRPVMEAAGFARQSPDFAALKRVNSKLWDIEDLIRAKERDKQFDEEFVRLARSVYFANDERSDIKRRINVAAGSQLVEEKEHVDYHKQEPL
jgi:hypothetical protein